MNLSGRFNISPVEKKRFLVDFTLQLAAGETVTNVVPTVSSPTDPNNNGGCTVTGIAVVPAGNQFTFFVSFTTPATADLQQYNVKFVTTTSLTQIYEDVIQFNVKDKGDA
jgi:hypothetical protein